MKWIKNQPLEDILARVITMQLLQLPKSMNFIDPISLFDYGIPRLYPTIIIELFANVVGWRINTWQKIMKPKHLQVWIYKNIDKICEQISIERFKKISMRAGHKNLFYLKCIQGNQTNIERCLP